jgi:hypothetical protein
MLGTVCGIRSSTDGEDEFGRQTGWALRIGVWWSVGMVLGVVRGVVR